MVTAQHEVLIVEDDDAIRQVLRDLLEDAGYAVREVADGVNALAILRSSPQALLVLLDNLLPGLDGADLLAALEGGTTATGASDLRPGPQHAYVLITASPRKITLELAERLARLGAPVVIKPFDIATFMGAVDQAERRLAAGSSVP